MIYSVIAGFILWSALWLGANFTLLVISPVWYGEGVKNSATLPLLLTICLSAFVSLVSGYVSSFIARGQEFSAALILGVLLLAFGVFVQVNVWNNYPLWFHLIFLTLLFPLTLLGSRWQRA